jgi:hypothetical protein
LGHAARRPATGGRPVITLFLSEPYPSSDGGIVRSDPHVYVAAGSDANSRVVGHCGSNAASEACSRNEVPWKRDFGN